MLYKILCRQTSCRIVTVEPVLFLYSFARYLYYPLIQQYIFWRYGNDRLQNSSYTFPNGSFCITKKELDHYGGNGTGDDVDESANFLVLYAQIANTLPSIVAAIVFASLSDYFGRKSLMVIVSLGAGLQGLGIIAIIHFQLNIYFFLLTNVISGMTGGMATILTLCFSYIADVTTLKQRTWRIGIAESMMYIGEASAQGAGGYWLQRLNCYFEQPMWVYVGCHTVIIAYVLLFLPESMSHTERLEKAKKRPRGYRAIIQGFRIFLGGIKEYSVWRLWAAMLSMCIVIINRVGSRQITTFFLLTDPLDWNSTKIGINGLLNRLCQGISLIFILPILILIGISDIVIVLVGLAFSCGTSIFTGFVTKTWEMFLVSVIQGMQGVVPSTLRGIMSKLVASHDQGALFSWIASAELISTLVATALYNTVYPMSLKHGLKSGSAYFLMAILYIIPMILILLLFVFRNKQGAQPLDEKQGTSSNHSEHDSLLGKNTSHHFKYGSDDQKIN